MNIAKLFRAPTKVRQLIVSQGFKTSSIQCLKTATINHGGHHGTGPEGLWRPAGIPANSDIVPTPMNDHHILYRSPYPPPPIYQLLMAEFAYAMLWAWLFFRLFQDYRMILTNEWEKPSWSQFTDEELGIPHWTEEDVE